MGIGSPRLRPRFRACALPLLVAAGFIGAPAAYAGTSPLDGLGGAPPVDDPPAAAPAPTPAVVVEAATTVVSAPAPAAPLPVDTAADAAAPAQPAVRQAVALVTDARPQLTAPDVAPAQPVRVLSPAARPPASPPPRTMARARPVAVRLHRDRPAFARVRPPAARRAVTSRPSPQIHLRLSRHAAPVVATLSGPRSELGPGGTAAGGVGGPGLRLLALAAAVLAWLLHGRGRRMCPVVSTLRSVPLVLELERPD